MAFRSATHLPVSAGWLIAIGVVFHGALALTTGLSPDEAHYALYGAHLDWSYFDHPPLVGWLQAPFVAAGGADFLMRWVPMASWLISLRLTISLCRQLPLAPAKSVVDLSQQDRWVALLLLLSPMLNLLGVALVPDSVLMPLVPAAMLATWRLKTAGAARRWRSWALLGTLLGLSGLAKYTGLLVIAGAFLSLRVFHGRSLWRMPQAWLTILIVALMVSPVLIWNMDHRWASVAYQSNHAVGDQTWQLRLAGRAILLQFALYGLLLPVALVRGALLVKHRSRDPQGDEVRQMRTMSLAFGAPVLLAFVILAGGGSSLPHWTACGWMGLMPLAIAGARGLPKALSWAMAGLQTLLLAGVLGLVLAGGLGREPASTEIVAPAAGVFPGVPNPVADVYGWESAALHASFLVEHQRARGIVVMNWSLASRLAWYARPTPVFVAPPRMDQFQLWFGALEPGDAAIVVNWSQMPLALPRGPGGFRRCSPLEQSATLVGGEQIAHFEYWYCEDWRSGPPGPRGSPDTPLSGR